MRYPFDIEWLGFEVADRSALRAQFDVDLGEARHRVLIRVSRRGVPEDLQVPALGLVGTTGDADLDARLFDHVQRRLIAARDAATVGNFDNKQAA